MQKLDLKKAYDSNAGQGFSFPDVNWNVSLIRTTFLIGVAAPQGPQDRAPVNVQTLLDKLMVSI